MMACDQVHQQQKHYPRPRRRPAHLRTKTGCLTCRKRKKKCDETPDVCKSCSRGIYACVWPESSHGGTSRTHDSSPEEVSLSRLVSFEPDVSVQNSTMADNSPLSCIYIPSMFTLNSISPESIPLFEFLRTAFLPTLIHPMSHPITIEFVKRENLRSAFSTPFLMHALLACCGAEFPADDMRYRRIAEAHYGKAITGLRDYLNSETGFRGKSIALLMTVIVLCIYERSKPRLSRGVDIHLLGAAQLIQLHLKQDQASISSESDTAMLHLMLEAFIFHATTSIPFQQSLVQPGAIDSAFPLAERALEESSLRSETCLYASSPIIGVPSKLFGYIREIVLMHQRCSVEAVDISRCYELQCILDQWDENMTMRRASLPGNLPSLETTPDVASLGPKLYILASRILLRCLINLAFSSINMDTRTDAHISSLVSDGVLLIAQLQPSTDYYAEYYCWPILVVGIWTVHQFECECLLSQIMAFWKATRNGTMRRLVDILTRYWEDRIWA